MLSGAGLRQAGISPRVVLVARVRQSIKRRRGSRRRSQ
jgi:hypothetical protein